LARNGEAGFRGQKSVFSQNRLSEIQTVSITLNHFSAATVFALFASIVFGITHRDKIRDMVRYGIYCFVMFLGGVLVAGWVMWLLRR
jgi:hypothetical protein